MRTPIDDMKEAVERALNDDTNPYEIAQREYERFRNKTRKVWKQ